MINCGRNSRKPSPEFSSDAYIPRSARLTAILGILVFTVFLCVSVDRNDGVDAANVFGEGAYQVFAQASGDADPPEDAFNEDDASFWMYLESVIARFIYGDR